MKSHDAIQEAIAGKTIEHAKALGLSTSLVNKWQEPATDYSDSGALNPIDRLATMMHTAVRLGRSAAPYAPLHCLAAECDHVAVRFPRKTGANNELTSELLDAVREFGTLAEVSAAAVADGTISRQEYERIEKQSYRVIREIVEFGLRAQKACGR